MSHPDSAPRGYVDVTIVDFAAHVAYLDPATGTGYLVVPRPELDIAALDDTLLEAARSDGHADVGRSVRLSLHAADRESALRHLAEDGWAPLLDEHGRIESAGRTAAGLEVLCLHGPPPAEEPTLEAIRCAVIALDLAADVHVRS